MLLHRHLYLFKATVTAAESSVIAGILISLITGLSFTDATTTCTVFVSTPPFPSSTFTVISTLPFAFGCGISVNLFPFTLTFKIDRSELVALYVKLSPSISVAPSSTIFAVLSSVIVGIVMLSSVGASFIGLITTVTVFVSIAPFSSSTFTVTSTLPFAFGFGVMLMLKYFLL